ncbi:MAG: threonine synthase, partial [Deltaproteobacteria bacterium]|nr:threonine synthase [Deltaproteobacteria bacterium]
NIFILHPHNRISPIQEKQMTTVTDANVFNIAVRGTFDDTQTIVKDVFGDIDFKTAFRLGAINSINWARVLAQVVYFIYSCLHLSSHEKDRATSFSVPTGNFGDIFAGFIAKKMLPEGSITTLLLATNANDILARFVNEGDYSRGKVIATSSPSMDIQAASNFERYLYYLYDRDPARVKDSMERFKQEGKLDLTSELDKIKRDFTAVSVSEGKIRETIATYYNQHNYILDPHTAVGVYAATKHRKQGIPMVCLATAHPAKFRESVQMAIDKQLDLPKALRSIINKPSRCEVMNADKKEIMTFITKNALK